MSYLTPSPYRSENLETLAADPQLMHSIAAGCELAKAKSAAVIAEIQVLMRKVGDPERYLSLNVFFAAWLEQAAGTRQDPC